MKMAEKVLLIGNGAREHAMAKKIVENENKLFHTWLMKIQE